MNKQGELSEVMEDQLSKAAEGAAAGSRWPALSYEEGVMATLSWILGHTHEPPMEDCHE